MMVLLFPIRYTKVKWMRPNTTTDDSKGQDRLLDAFKFLNMHAVEVGIFGGVNRRKSKKYPNRKRPKKGTPIALYGAVHEFGSRDGTIPERSFLRSTIDKNQKKYDNLFEQGMADVMKGRKTVNGVLTELAKLTIKGDIQIKITDLHLIDTSALRMAITGKVVKGFLTA